MSTESFIEFGKTTAKIAAKLGDLAQALDDVSKVPCFTTPLWKETPRVMISINPRWCELIASGKKTIEVRKTRPGIEKPFKCYIYETKGKTDTPFIDEDGHLDFHGRGQVIGEFICDKITINYRSYTKNGMGYWDVPEGSCLTYDELFDYGKGKVLYCWHISDLVIYDKPKELSEFFMPCREYFEKNIPCCGDCEYYKERYEYPAECACEGMKPLKRPFQSWGYAENYTEAT